MYVSFGSLFIIVSTVWCFVSIFLFLLSSLISHSSMGTNRTSCECGFESVGEVRTPFCLHFYVNLLVFLVFDLEIVFLLGFLVGGSFWLFFSFMLFIFFTYYLEVFFGGLFWVVVSLV